MAQTNDQALAELRALAEESDAKDPISQALGGLDTAIANDLAEAVTKAEDKEDDELAAKNAEEVPFPKVLNPEAAEVLKRIGGLPIVRVAEKERLFNMLVYGMPGVGKTVLAGSVTEIEDMSPVLFVDVEGGTMSIADAYPDTEVVRATSFTQLQGLYADLHKGRGGYKTIVIDSLSEMQKFSMGTIMKQAVIDRPDQDPEVPSVREWGKNGEQIRRMVRAFRDLPVNTIFTCLLKSDKDPRTGLNMGKPALPGQLANEISGYFDIVTHMYVKIVKGEASRLLLTTQTDSFVGKDRSRKLPAVIIDPTMRTIMDYINNKENGNGNQG
jgi:hypothetical protein